MTADPWRALTNRQRVVARAFLALRDAERTHLVVYLSGAHAYGFPSPDSDLDLPADSAGDRIEVIDGVELDYGSTGGGDRGCRRVATRSAPRALVDAGYGL